MGERPSGPDACIQKCDGRSSSAAKWWRWRLRTECACRCRAGGAQILCSAIDRGCKPAGRRVARSGWPGAQPDDKRRRRAGANLGQHFAGIHPSPTRFPRARKAQFGFVLSGLAFDLSSLPWLSWSYSCFWGLMAGRTADNVGKMKLVRPGHTHLCRISVLVDWNVPGLKCDRLQATSGPNCTVPHIRSFSGPQCRSKQIRSSPATYSYRNVKRLCC